MKQKILFALWGFLFILCAGLGFIPEPEGALKWLLCILGIAFFVPGGLLLYRAVQEKDTKLLRLIRRICLISLTLTALLLVLNILSVMWNETLGSVLYCLLILVSSPMICCGSYALSLFLWACLLTVSLKFANNKK